MTHPHNSMASRSVLVFVRGIYGSGKSYLTRALERALRDDVVVLDPDAIDYESQTYKKHVEQQIEEGVEAALHAYRFLRARAYDGISNHKIIIWNQPFSNLEIFQKMIGRMQDHAAEQHVSLAILIVEVELDPALARERVTGRKQRGGHGPSDETFTRLVNDYASFSHLGFKTVSVDGGGDVNASVSSVLSAIQTLRAADTST